MAASKNRIDADMSASCICRSADDACDDAGLVKLAKISMNDAGRLVCSHTTARGLPASQRADELPAASSTRALSPNQHVVIARECQLKRTIGLPCSLVVRNSPISNAACFLNPCAGLVQQQRPGGGRWDRQGGGQACPDGRDARMAATTSA